MSCRLVRVKQFLDHACINSSAHACSLVRSPTVIWRALAKKGHVNGSAPRVATLNRTQEVRMSVCSKRALLPFVWGEVVGHLLDLERARAESFTILESWRPDYGHTRALQTFPCTNHLHLDEMCTDETLENEECRAPSFEHSTGHVTEAVIKKARKGSLHRQLFGCRYGLGG